MISQKYFSLLLLLLVFALPLFAQQQHPEKIKFQSVINVGLLEGENGSAFQLQTINGIKYKSWFSGVGVGLDYYRYRTIPLFLNIRKEFLRSANKIFVYADAGINFYWQRDKDVKQFSFNDKFKNGFYGSAGAGYSIQLNKKYALQFSGGYSYKKLTEEGEVFFLTGYFPPGTSGSNNMKINYNFNCLQLKAGFVF